MESKKEIYDLMPQEIYPKTLLITTGMDFKTIRYEIEQANLSFPLVGKPDIGMRGLAVKKLHNWKELDDYFLNSKVDFLIQEFISYEIEAGIFYYRFPSEKNGNISGIVLKEFLSVEGDGSSTVVELLAREKRSILQLARLQNDYPQLSSLVLPGGVRKILVPYGNHSLGAKFLDASFKINKELVNCIDNICKQINGFYYGRIDIRFNSWEELIEGKNFSIIELNGAGSEPTHIYDPKHSIFFAWREIIRHAKILYRISKQNQKQFGYMNFQSGIKMIYENSQHIKLLTRKRKLKQSFPFVSPVFSSLPQAL
jgi:hypothetical protein